MIVSSSRTMHPQSPPLTIGGTVLKESDDLDRLGVTFDSEMRFEKHLRWVSRADSQRLGILRKSWRVSDDMSLLCKCFRGFVLAVLEYCSAVWCLAADKQMDRAVSGTRFLTEGMLECDIADRRSVALLCMLYKIRCNPMHPLVLYLDRICQCRLHDVLWLHIAILMRCLAADLAVPQDFYSSLSVL